MTELTTRTEIATPEDDDIMPIRKGSVAGWLKIRLAQLKAYVGIPAFATGTAGQALILNVTEDGIVFGDVASGGGGGAGGSAKKALFQDQKPVGTISGTSVAGAWGTRDLNTEVFDDIGVSVASNQLTIPAGTYDLEAITTVYRTNRYRAKIRDITNGVDLLYSMSGYDTTNTSGGNNYCRIEGRITLAGPTVIELQYYVQAGAASNGLGVESNFDGVIEIFSQILLEEVLASSLGKFVVKDVKATTVDGQSLTAGSWETRELNTEDYNNLAGASLATNQITLPAGTYEIDCAVPGQRVNLMQARLQNITDVATVAYGSNVLADSGADGSGAYSIIKTVFTIAAEKTFEIQHRVQTTFATGGGGANDFGGDEVYTQVSINKIA